MQAWLTRLTEFGVVNLHINAGEKSVFYVMSAALELEAPFHGSKTWLS